MKDYNMKMKTLPLSPEIRGIMIREKRWEASKAKVEEIVDLLIAKGARFYRYKIYGVYVYLNDYLYNLEYKILIDCLLHRALGFGKLPNEKDIVGILFLRISGMATEIPSGAGSANGIKDPKYNGHWRTHHIDDWVEALIKANII
jgi:hypothetical protein